MAHLSQLPDWSTEYRFAVDVPLPSPESFFQEIETLAWTNAMTYAGLAVSVIGAALLIRSFSK